MKLIILKETRSRLRLTSQLFVTFTEATVRIVAWKKLKLK